jgi:hypothetical protein
MILTASLVKTSLFLIPSLTVEFPLGPFYVKQVSSAECSPTRVPRWNPQTAIWDVEAGVNIVNIKLFAGHRSYHAIGKQDNLDSYDYFGVSYQKEFK